METVTMPRISQKMALPFSFVFVFLLGCTSVEKNNFQKNHIKVIPEKKHLVWKSIQKVLDFTNLEVLDPENGFIQTEKIPLGKYWKPAHKKFNEEEYAGKLYRILVYVKESFDKKRTSVEIQKKVYSQTDFFSKENISSGDGVQEEVLLYEIDRKTRLEKTLKKLGDQFE